MGMLRKFNTLVLLIMSLLLIAPLALAEIKMSFSPVWNSTFGTYHTGVGWGDFDGDGWKDLVVSNGLDIVPSQNAIYYNDGGDLQWEPGWIDDYGTYSDNLCVADFDSDGDPDVAMACLGNAHTAFPVVAQLLYYNDDGLSTSPFEFKHQNAFSCAAGDVDGDGDMDLAYAFGCNSLTPAWIKYRQAAVFLNEGGVIDSIPDWESDSSYIGIDIAFGDVDLDGDLDLAVGARNSGVMVFFNDNGVLEANPSWHDGYILGGRQICFGDIDGDDYPELAVAGMGQGFFVYQNLGGTFESSPGWINYTTAQPSCVSLVDIDADGDLDLAGGTWYNNLIIYENDGGTLDYTPNWFYEGDGRTFWCQQLAWADYDEDGLVDSVREFAGNGTRKLFDLKTKVVHEIYSVEVDGSPLDLSEFCYDLNEGWVSLGSAPDVGSTLSIHYAYTTDPDMAVTENNRIWVFENQQVTDEDDVNVLLLTDNNYGANYNVQDANPNIRDNFESYGWNITVTAVNATATPCSWGQANVGSPGLLVDVALADINDITKYDALVIMPGSSGHPTTMGSSTALDFIRMAVDSGLVVAAWCRSVRVLAAADLINGLDVVGHADYASAYAAAGANYLGNDHPPVIQGNIITSVRSRFYRREMCEAIKQVIDASLPPTIDDSKHTFAPTPLDAVTITTKIADHGFITNAELYVDTGYGFVSTQLYDDGLHDDGVSGDSVYGAILPPVTEGTIVSYYIVAEDDQGGVSYDPPAAPAETHSFTCLIGYTSAGTEVPVVLSDSLAVTFERVTTPGMTSVTLETSGQAAPEGYSIYPVGASVWFNIETTAEYSGDVTVCLGYDQSLLTRIESWLTLWHYGGDPAEWVDITTSVDSSANLICGVSGTLSAFVIAEEASCCGQFTGRHTGNCNCSEDGKLTLSDITKLIDRVYISQEPLCCEENGNTNGSLDGKITLSDITVLIDAVYISQTSPEACS